MDKNQLIKNINKLLDDSPFDDYETRKWQEKMTKMNETDLQELFNLLNEKLKIITDTNKLFVGIADDLAKEEEKKEKIIPEEIDILDKKIEDLAVIFQNNLSSFIKSKKRDLLFQLDRYFKYSSLLNENVIEEFDILLKALFNNNEILFSKNPNVNKVKIKEWLSLYNQFNDKEDRKSLDRINFASQNDKAIKLNEEDKKILLKLLKLYDYLLNPENVIISSGGKTKQKDRIIFKKSELLPNKDNVEELKKILTQYPPNSLERKAIEEEIRKLNHES